MFGVRELNISIELWGVVFCVIGIVCAYFFARADLRYRNLLITMFSLEFASAGGDAIAGFCRGQEGWGAWLGCHLGNFATFAAGFFLVAAFTQYLCYRLDSKGDPRLAAWSRAVWALAAIWSCLAVLGVFYYIDPSNIYHRTNWFWLSQAFVFALQAVNAVLVLRYRHRLSNAALACLLLYTLAPIAASVMQAAIYGLNFMTIAAVLGLVVIFLEMQAFQSNALIERTKALAQARADATDSRIAAAVSQIQPHFLFNSLDSIYHLVSENPQQAQRAIDEFSTYLRANLDSLSHTEPVPIEAELDHVRTYLDLEKISMEDALNYQIDDQAHGFLVPALSLQTLAENAVKHGIGKRPEGGTVIVRTREQRDCYLASVIDDGVGFDADAVSTHGHVGIENTRARLEAMCNASLEITSSPGKGTNAVMRIPTEAR